MLKAIRKSKVLEASFWSMLSELALKVVTPVSYLIITRYLKPEEFGAVAVITTIVAFLAIVSDLGVSKLLVQNNDFLGSQRTQFIHHCISMSLLIGISLMILLIVLVTPVVDFFDIADNKSDLFILSFNIPFLAISGALSGLLKKGFEFKKIFKIRVVSIVVPSLISIVLVLCGFGVTAIVLSQFLSSVISVILTYQAIDYKFSFFYSREYNALIFGRSFWNSIEQIFLWLPMSIDIFLMNIYLSKHDIGLYTTSRTLFTSAIALTLGAISPVAFSLYSKNNQNIDRLLKVFSASHYLIFFLSAFLGVSVFLFFEVFESYLFTEEWLGVAEITSVIFILLTVNYFVNPFQDLFNSLGEFRFTSLMVITNLLITVPFLFISIQHGLLAYLLTRFSFLFLKIIPIWYKMKRINAGAVFFSYFINTKYVWLFFFTGVLSNYVFSNIISKLICFIFCSALLFVLDRSRLVYAAKTLIKN